MRIMSHLAKGNPPLVKVAATIPAPASGNTNSATITHNFTDALGNAVAPEVVIPVVRGDETREVHVYVVSVTSTAVTLRAVTSEATMTAVNVDLYLG